MKEFLPVRLSSLLGHFSVGAVVRGPHALMTVMDTRYWTDRNGNDAGRPLRYVDRVRAALEIEQELREPPIAKEGEKFNQVDGVCIPARRFPRWGECPDCGLLHFLPSLSEKDSPPKCQESDIKKCPSRPRLEQVADIVVHEKGYMDDVPWHFLCHIDPNRPAQSQCRPDTHSHYLRFERDKVDSRKGRIKCGRCLAEKRFDPIALRHSIKYIRHQPWLQDSVKLEPPPEILKVNDIRVHLSIRTDALIIPPESRIKKGTVVDRLYSSVEKRRLMETCKTPLQWKSTVRRIAGEFRCGTDTVEKAWKEIQNGYPLYDETFNITPGQLRQDEYKALVEVIPYVSDDEDFVTKHNTANWRRLSEKLSKNSLEWHVSHALDRLIAVVRLKKVGVLLGFSRFKLDSGERIVVKPDIIGKSDWLPAVEYFGEGLFITFDQTQLGMWENLPVIRARADVIQKRYEAGTRIINNELNRISPRLLFLHTFAHLLIRQLEIDAGYPAASLQERIYCGEGDFPMAGILIYVAVPDIAGSLGGIVELAEPRRFLALATAAVARSKWCSLDPVCSEHEGQGMNLLNRAACHACLLIPEPSCEYMNTLLDRVFVKGDPENGIPGFFDFEGASGAEQNG
jgi:hypothetical protein